ncbi:MAG TPA: cupredoxin domain-containing protein [Hyphomicrobiaceae bacterium]|jgi:plastocyanin|nr:cupredoxin domain-containing protein [Hyphomicrobiaceae bacterium]
MPNFRSLVRLFAAAGAAIWLLGASMPSANAQESYTLTIHDDRFEPASLDVKAGTKFKLVVKNARKVAAEFESHDINREKVIPAGRSVTINVGPLKAGSYAIFDDFHKSTKGHIVAK